jgi:hypothetical protein
MSLLSPLSWNAYHNLTRDRYIEYTCCCVQARFLGMETKIPFPLSLYIKRYFIMYLKILTNLYKYIAEVQLPGNGILLLSIPQRFYSLHRVQTWLGIND